MSVKAGQAQIEVVTGTVAGQPRLTVANSGPRYRPTRSTGFCNRSNG
jgi:hypothetical protein